MPPEQRASPPESAIQHEAPVHPWEPKAPGGSSSASQAELLAPRPGDASPSREEQPAPAWAFQAEPARAERMEALRAVPKSPARRPPAAERPRQAARSRSGASGEQQALAEVLPVDWLPREGQRVRPLPAREQGSAVEWRPQAPARLECPPCSPVPVASPASPGRLGEPARAAAQRSPAGMARPVSPGSSAARKAEARPQAAWARAPWSSAEAPCLRSAVPPPVAGEASSRRQPPEPLPREEVEARR
jgi:hypothetical protein